MAGRGGIGVVAKFSWGLLGSEECLVNKDSCVCVCVCALKCGGMEEVTHAAQESEPFVHEVTWDYKETLLF